MSDAKYETRGVLAGRYRAGQMERVMHTHLAEAEGETALCNKKIELADTYSCTEAERYARPTCPKCAKRYDRSARRDPGEAGMKLDRRYTIAREYTGHASAKPQYVARFMGKRIGSSSTRAGATKFAKAWEAARWSGGRDPAYGRKSPMKRRKPAKKRASARDHACSCSHPPKRAAKKKVLVRKKRAAPKRDAQRTCPIGTEIQTLVLSQQFFTERQAAGWIKRHGFRSPKIDITTNNYRFRQHPPSNFRAGSFRTIRLRPGVEAVIGCPQ